MDRRYRELLDFLKNRFAGAVLSVLEDAGGVLIVHASGTRLRDLMAYLRDRKGFEFNTLTLITGVDFPDREVIEVVYHLHSMTHNHHLIVKVEVDRSKRHPSVDSIHDIYSSANWMERETYDLLGVEFIGHPDLRRLLLPRDWVGHPLRKDYVEPGEYRGTPTRRD